MEREADPRAEGWTPEAEAAYQEALEDIRRVRAALDDEVEGHRVCDDDDLWLVGLLVAALSGAFTASVFWLIAWSVWHG